MQQHLDFNKIFSSVFKIKLGQNVINELDYTLAEYQDHMENIDSINRNNYKIYNEAMRLNEILYTHSMELHSTEKQLLVEGVVNYNSKNDSIRYLTEIFLKKGNLTILNIKRLHSILMNGVSFDEEKNKKFRVNDDIFVGYYENNNKVVQYIPPKSSDIDFSMMEVLTYINDPDSDLYSYNLFLQPIICHALVAILQPFDDGNTRVSRILHYVTTLKNTNDVCNKDYHYPIIYLSHSFYPFQKQYRDLIQQIALDPSSDNWNKWIMFNLHSIQDYFNYSNDFIEKNNLRYSNSIFDENKNKVK